MFIMFLLRDKLLSVEDEEGRVPPTQARPRRRAAAATAALVVVDVAVATDAAVAVTVGHGGRH